MHPWTETDWIGGHAALDFLNTVSDVGKSRRETRLKTWKDFLNWLTAAKLVPAFHFVRIDHVATLAALHALREQAYAVFHDLAAGTSPRPDALARLQDAIKTAFQHAELQVLAGTVRWSLRKKRGTPQDQLAFLFDDLLRSKELHRLRECGRCTWLFLDTGRGTGRKWCDMRKCGNRAKSEVFRAKRTSRRNARRG